MSHSAAVQWGSVQHDHSSRWNYVGGPRQEGEEEEVGVNGTWTELFILYKKWVDK